MGVVCGVCTGICGVVCEEEKSINGYVTLDLILYGLCRQRMFYAAVREEYCG